MDDQENVEKHDSDDPLTSDVAEHIPPTEDGAQYDATTKDILSHRWTLAQILRHVLPELEGRSVEEVDAMIESEIHTGVPAEPGRTNAPKNVHGHRIIGLNTEDTAQNEGTVRYDIFFEMALEDAQTNTTVEVVVDFEPMRQLSQVYELGDRKQVYGMRAVGSQIERYITGQKYGDARPYIGIWLCFNRKTNSFGYGEYTENWSWHSNDENGTKTDERLRSHRSLIRIYTIGFTNAGPDPEQKEQRDLYKLLAGLFSATMDKKEKIEILENDFHLQSAQESVKIKEDVTKMDQLGEIIRRDMQKQLKAKDSQIKAKDSQIQKLTQEKDAQIQAKDAQIQKLTLEIQELRAQLAGGA